MRDGRSRVAVVAGVLVLAVLGLAGNALVAQAGGSSTGVLTAGYNNLRDNWDPEEPGLSPSAIQSASFGKLFSTKVEGAVYAQPLVVNGDVIVTTERAKAYAINGSTGAILWSRTFGTPFKASTIGCSDLKPYIGSTSTPVVDPSTGTIYMTTRLQEGSGLSNAHWYLQALSASTGQEVEGFPVRISGTPVNTPGVPFNDNYQMQRPGLLLLNGVVYMGFASDCDIAPYRGIVVGVSTSAHKITTMWSDESGTGTDENSEAGIWQGGGGLVSDIPGRIIVTSGNGVSPTAAPSNDPPDTLSESVIGLTVGSGGELKPTQFFSPSNAPTLDQNDEDLGSGGPVALPTEYFGTSAHKHLVVQVGKDGRIFLVDADNMGGSQQGPGKTDAVLQTLGPFDGVWGHPAAYGGQGGWVYVLESAGGGYLRALSYGLNGQGTPALTSVATSAESFGYTSGSPLVTSSGTTAGSAVVWVVYASGLSGRKAELRAYSAAPSGANLPLLWSTHIGTASKFAVPTAYDGRVYVGTRDGHLIAYGSSAAAPVQAAALDAGQVAVGTSKTLTLSISATTPLKITGPLTVSGEEGAPGIAAVTASRGRAHAAAHPKAKVLTAGPANPNGSGTVGLGRTVFRVRRQPLGAHIAAGGTIRVKVTFTPAHAGPDVGELSIPTSAGTRTVTVSGYGTAPGLLISAQPLAFGTVDTGAGGKGLALTLSNSWDRPETFLGANGPGGPYTVTGLPAAGTVLAPRQAVTASVHFDPGHAGTYPSTLQLATSQGTLTVPVSATAVSGAPRLAVDPASISLGSVPVGQSTTASFDVGNSGTVPLTISRAIAPLGMFSVTEPVPEGLRLDAGTFIHVTVTFQPTEAGVFTGRYLFNSNDGRGYVAVTFTGTGT